MKSVLKILLVCPFFLTLACGGSQSTKFSTDLNTSNNSESIDDTQIEQKVIYGEDDRKEFYEINSKSWKKIARSTVALIPELDLKPGSNSYYLEGETFGDYYDLCKSEPFRNQKSAAICSGSLVGDDIVMTAGHCITSELECKRISFVFDYARNSKSHNIRSVPKDSVYGCKTLIKSQLDGSRGTDFALIQLDRKVKDRQPLAVRQSGLIPNKQSLVVIGHPSGLPMKYAGGAKVRSNVFKNYFIANLDTYGGNSGSAVFNGKTQKIEGILVRGENDFVFKGSCRVSNRCSETGCRGEDVTRVSEVLPYLNQ